MQNRGETVDELCESYGVPRQYVKRTSHVLGIDEREFFELISVNTQKTHERKKEKDNEAITREELEIIDSNVRFKPCSDERLMDIHENCRKKLIGASFNQKVCAICDRFIQEDQSSCVTVNDKFIEKCKNKLSPRIDLHPDLVSYYDVSEDVEELKGVLLSPRSHFIRTEKGRKVVVNMITCSVCKNSMNQSKKEFTPPKFAIANGFEIGELPNDLKEATMPEIWITSLSSMTPPVHRIYGGKHQTLRSHATAFVSNPFEIVEKLERISNGSALYLVMFGSNLTTAQKKLFDRSTGFAMICWIV